MATGSPETTSAPRPTGPPRSTATASTASTASATWTELRCDHARFVVSNLFHLTAEQVYDELYVQRGDAANRIEEQQPGLFAERTSGSQFLANQFRLLPAPAAYVLIEHVRRIGLKGTELARAPLTTIRTKLLKLGGRARISVRRIYLSRAGGHALQTLFRRVACRLTRAAAAPPART